MKISKFRFEELENKKAFVKKISDVVVGGWGISVEKLDYHYFADRYSGVREYVIITYKGGAHAAVNVAGTSVLGIYRDIGRYLDSGSEGGYDCYRYYQEDLDASLAAGEAIEVE